MDQVRLDIERQALARPVAGWRTPRRKPHALPFGSQNRTLGEAERGPQVTGHRVTCGFVVGVAGFEPAASSSRTKRAAKLRYTPPARNLRCRARLRQSSGSAALLAHCQPERQPARQAQHNRGLARLGPTDSA